MFNENIGRTSKVKHENYYADHNHVTWHDIVMLRLDEDLSKKIASRCWNKELQLPQTVHRLLRPFWSLRRIVLSIFVLIIEN